MSIVNITKETSHKVQKIKSIKIVYLYYRQITERKVRNIKTDTQTVSSGPDVLK